MGDVRSDFVLPAWIPQHGDAWPTVRDLYMSVPEPDEFWRVWKCSSLGRFNELAAVAISQWNVSAVAALVLHPLSSSELLGVLLRDRRLPLELRVWLVYHPALSGDVLDGLVGSDSPRMLEALFSRADLTAERVMLVLSRPRHFLTHMMAARALAANEHVDESVRVLGVLLQ